MSKTVARGAVIERDLVQRKLTRLKLKYNAGTGDADAEFTFTDGVNDVIDTLRDWLKTQPIRTRRPGGIGR